MLDLIWNLFQDEDIDRLRAERRRQEAQSDELQKQAGSTQTRNAELEMRHEQLKLVTLALWRLLQDRVGLTEVELKRYVESTDLLDGAVDGKADLTRELVECPRCSRAVLNTAIACPYCGTRQVSGNAFDRA
jgi:DNA-directed RNA polymerase subunit RPC12/RpoP